jgi:hypothetical protein
MNRSSGVSSSTAPCASSHAAMSELPLSSASVCGVAPSARRFALVAPREIGVGPVLEQPARPSRVVAPEHHVHERRHAAGYAVHVQAIAIQQFERVEITAASGDVRRHAISGVGTSVEEHFGERQVAHRANRCPQCRSR